MVFGPASGDLMVGARNAIDVCLAASLEGAPLTPGIAGARLVSVTCERDDLERDFRAYCGIDANSNRVGELAFGTNIALHGMMIGVLVQDEKVPGVHVDVLTQIGRAHV